MGASQRTKGHNFERAIANAFRKRWPHLADRIRRSQQAHQAFEPDVVIEGVPLWVECQCSRKPTPMAKLEQAEGDIARCAIDMVPVAVWRKSGERSAKATMRWWALAESTGCDMPDSMDDRLLVVTVDFDEWLDRVDLEWVTERFGKEVAA